MVDSYDVGSLPFVGDIAKFRQGATRYTSLREDSAALYFEQMLIESFLDKIKAGINIPSYPQFQDMNETFLSMIEGVEKVAGGYMESGILSIKDGVGSIPEVLAIKNRSKDIYERLGGSFRVRVCITGPYTLSSLFVYRDKGIFKRLGDILSQIVESNIFNEKHWRVSLIALDEPVFGLIDDPLMDRGSEARENLRKAWESIFHKAVSKGVQTVLHLHNTSDELFWEAESLNIIEPPINDPLYQSKRTRELIESTNKSLNASIAITDFDRLIQENMVATTQRKLSETAINEKVAEAWKNITDKKLDSTVFLENVGLMKERLVKIVERFGASKVSYVGPECGLRGFPTYECALKCLRRVSNVARSVKI